MKDLAFLGAKKRLYLARSKIYLSVDYGEIDASNKSVIIVVVCFLGRDGRLQKITLKLVEIVGRHTGELLAKYVMAAIVEWDIVYLLGFFQIDNASNNETLIQAVSIGNVPQHVKTYFSGLNLANLNTRTHLTSILN